MLQGACGLVRPPLRIFSFSFYSNKSYSSNSFLCVYAAAFCRSKFSCSLSRQSLPFTQQIKTARRWFYAHFFFFFVFLSVLYCTFIFFSVFLCALLFFLCYYRCFFGSLKRAPFCLVFCYAVFYLYFILHFPFFLSIRTQSNQSYRLKTGINVCSLHLRYNIY